MALSSTVQAAWEANIRVNEALLDHLTPEMLSARTPAGGFSVAQHLAHLAGTVKYWGAQLDEARMMALPGLFRIDEEAVNDVDAFIALADLPRIREVLKQTAETAKAAVQSAPEGARGKLPHPSGEAYLIHMMVHDAHHRGQVLLALKTAGYPLPDEELLWGPWCGE